MYKKALLILNFLFLSNIVLAQNNNDPFRTDDEKINFYYNKVDSISDIIYAKANLDNLKYSYKYIEKINNYKNIIKLNNWEDKEVVFVFKDDNLSYLTPEVFDSFRRDFYQDKKLNVLVYLNNEQFKNHFFKTNLSKDTITYYKTEDYITTAIYFKDLERFLILEYYFENTKLIKTKIRELDSGFNRELINYSEFYYSDSKIIYQKFYQTITIENYDLEVKFKENELLKIASEILVNIEKKQKTKK